MVILTTAAVIIAKKIIIAVKLLKRKIKRKTKILSFKIYKNIFNIYDN